MQILITPRLCRNGIYRDRQLIKRPPVKRLIMIVPPNTGYLEKKTPRKKYPGNVGRSIETNVEHPGTSWVMPETGNQTAVQQKTT